MNLQIKMIEESLPILHPKKEIPAARRIAISQNEGTTIFDLSIVCGHYEHIRSQIDLMQFERPTFGEMTTFLYHLYTDHTNMSGIFPNRILYQQLKNQSHQIVFLGFTKVLYLA